MVNNNVTSCIVLYIRCMYIVRMNCFWRTLYISWSRL